MPKWNEWYDSLPEHTRASMKNQPIWRDVDLAKFALIAFVAGIILGWMI
jgi:hypothetical protein